MYRRGLDRPVEVGKGKTDERQFLNGARGYELNNQPVSPGLDNMADQM